MCGKYEHEVLPFQDLSIIQTKLMGQMFLLKDTYNALLEKAKAEYKENGRTMSKFDMDKLLTTIKVESTELNAVYSQALQNIAKRITDAYIGFFSRIK